MEGRGLFTLLALHASQVPTRRAGSIPENTPSSKYTETYVGSKDSSPTPEGVKVKSLPPDVGSLVAACSSADQPSIVTLKQDLRGRLSLSLLITTDKLGEHFARCRVINFISILRPLSRPE